MVTPSDLAKGMFTVDFILDVARRGSLGMVVLGALFALIVFVLIELTFRYYLLGMAGLRDFCNKHTDNKIIRK